MHNGEFRNIDFSSNVLRSISSRKVEWAGHVAHRTEDKLSKNVGEKTRRV
jgi:hypothetical protein